MIIRCPECGEDVEGVDLGDNPCYLEFACECGWNEGKIVTDNLIEEATHRMEAERES